jgi:hypothetical protein
MQSLETLTLDPSHPWVAEALARPGDEAEDGAPWEDYAPGEGRWSGSREWASADGGDTDLVGQRETPTEDDAWNGEGAPADAATPPWPQPGADWESAASDGVGGATDADSWDDPYTHQTHQWSLAAAEADLHGPDDEAATPAYNPDENTADGVAPADGEPPEGLPGALARSGNGHEGNGLADPYEPWQPPVAAVHEHSPSADYGDEEPGETLH